MTDTGRTRVAVACQGGGSHTAFTAGVLKRLLGADELAGVEVVGLSGTSGGAVCALLAWSALLEDDPASAGRLLEDFWADNSATTPLEQLVNSWVVWAARLEHMVVLPAVSPYDNFGSVQALQEFRAMLERRVDFKRFAVQTDGSGPMLLIGAVDVRSGEFKAFNSRRDRITADMILASAAIPNLFRSVQIDGASYWDGLFSQNPPIHDLMVHEIDELWLIQINASACAKVPTETHEILDRRNELAGNLSMVQELAFIEAINRAIARGAIVDPKYRPIQVGRIALDRELNYRSKLDRRPELLEQLREYGRTKWRGFVKERESRKYATLPGNPHRSAAE